MHLSSPELLLVAATALGLGLLHGLGPDHLAAITTFISRNQLAVANSGGEKGGSRKGPWAAARLGLSFGLGHMATLVVVGGLGLALGWVAPAGFERGTEFFGGGLLLLLGGWLALESRQGRYHAHPHRHDSPDGGGYLHRHWHSHATGDDHQTPRPPHGHGHRHPTWSLWLATLGARLRPPKDRLMPSEGRARERTSLALGGLFALSGLRSLLLMVPVMVSASAAGAAAVVLLFGLGIVASMSGYGLVVARVYYRLGSTEQLARRAAQLTALVCLGLGVAWINLAWSA